ncbi:MAG: hypothetical protein HY073_03525, partial [Deltaproteobacteria bacterium]|nr:hypothetical protein [Deltaproteobacteria bacterium]
MKLGKMIVTGIAMTFAFSSLFFGGTSGCGSGSEAASTPTDSGSGTSSGTGTASTASLSTVPSVDISNLDLSTTTSSSSSLSAAALRTGDNDDMEALDADSSTKKGLAGNMNQIGSASRAGCESNSHKQEVIRMGQQAQLERCYPEAMEKAGLITIPTGSYAYYQIVPPAEAKQGSSKACDGIPAERTDEIAACKKGGDGPANSTMNLRIGRIDGSLQIDMCNDTTLVDESTYGASGSKYTADVTHQQSFNGNSNAMNFAGTIDLGTDGKVTNGIPDLGTTGSASVTSRMNGGPGSGSIAFVADGATKSNKVSGGFLGGFKDQRSGLSTSFTGKVYS